MKCQSLFSGENNIISLTSAELEHRVVKLTVRTTFGSTEI